MSSKSPSEKLSQLRALFKKSENNISAYIVPSEDAHSSEYIASSDMRRAYISEFTGSAGFAIISEKKAALWTDGRYFLQAEKELDSSQWTLMKSGLPGTPSKEDWLLKELAVGQRVGIDPKLIPSEAAHKLSEFLNIHQRSLIAIPNNLIDEVWKDDSRPNRPSNTIFPLSEQFSGLSWCNKVESLRECIRKRTDGVCGMVVSALDEIAWIFNLRGSDIDFNPVFFAYALIQIDSNDVFFFVDEKQLSVAAKESLSQTRNTNNNIVILPYESIFEKLRQTSDKKILLASNASWELSRCFKNNANYVISISPVMIQKSIKNEVELEGFRQCHIRDGAALVKYFAWLENELVVKKNTELNEFSAAEKLEEFRSGGKFFKGLSFPTISGFGPNGAIIHYKPEKETALKLNTEHVYLCDSGAQYLDGTTDVTRTMHFGEPTKFQKEAFTRVLQGNIQLNLTKFPVGTSGYLIDSIARRSLWSVGLNYLHGTGHGVGHFLNVHEGPQGIGTRAAYNDVTLNAGMTVTDEPGYYENGEFGIRIENVLLIRKEANIKNEFLKFECITMAPIQKKMIDVSILNSEEIEWLNCYHEEVWNKVGNLLREEKDETSLAWLREATLPIHK